MSEARIRKGAAGVVTLIVVGLLLVAWKPGQQVASGPAKKVKPKQRPPGKPVQFSANLATVVVSLGLRDAKAKAWDGRVSLSQGKILGVEIVRGNAKNQVKGEQFFVRSVFPKKKKKKKEVTRPVLQISVDAPPGAKLSLATKQGEFTVPLDDLTDSKARYYLEKQAKAVRTLGALRLTDPETEDDYAALANAPDGKVWLVYSEYQKGKPYLLERVLRGEFEDLVPNGNGDQIRMKVFDGKSWSPCINVTDTGLDIWRPKVAVDKANNVHVAWAAQVDGNWDIYCRTYGVGELGNPRFWSKTRRITTEKGTDFNVAITTDAKGTPWLAWQAWRDGNFQILAAPMTGDKIKTVALTKAAANHWCPTISADSKGNVFVAYDTYAKGNYDVRLAKLTKKGDAVQVTTTNIADSARFEARPFVLCDKQDRVWVAYELGDEQWGKDYSTNNFRKIGFDENPGFALYINRTVVVNCVVDGNVKQLEGSFEKAFKGTLNRNRNLPRLAMDAKGGLWLFVRHHPLAGGAGEVWTSWGSRYDGKKWSTPQQLPQSRNILDKRPDYVPFGPGILSVYSGDARMRTNDRNQADLFAAVLPATSEAKPFKLVAAAIPTPKPTMKPVHPNETADVKRIREYRIEHKGKKLRLYRGEFHRHTEYTAHRDQDGSLDDAWRYALDAGNMDWMGDGDHDNGYFHEFMWWQIQKITDFYHHPPVFTAVQSYERSNVFPNGHRNAILPKRGIRPLPRGNLKGDPVKGTPDTKLFYAYLHHFGGICASHTSGTNMGTDWRDNDPVVEPIVEIYQGHRHNYEHYGAPRSATQKTNIGGYQPSGFVWNAFAKGYKLGFQSSSDHVSTHMSYAVVLTDDVTRQGLIDAFKRRHCYAATDNIIMDVRSGEQLMGDIFTTNKRPTLEITVKGTAPITKLHVVRNSKYVYSMEPNKNEVTLKYTDADIKPGSEAFYYVRVEQRDANLAWSSPMWITYKE